MGNNGFCYYPLLTSPTCRCTKPVRHTVVIGAGDATSHVLPTKTYKEQENVAGVGQQQFEYHQGRKRHH